MKKYIIHFLVKKLLRAITEEDVLRSDGRGGFICKGKTLSREMVDQIQLEADILRNSPTLKLLLDDMEFLAHQTMFEKSSSFNDMLFGKAMLYNIDVLKRKIQNLAK